jgi:hypothetical protein
VGERRLGESAKRILRRISEHTREEMKTGGIM